MRKMSSDRSNIVKFFLLFFNCFRKRDSEICSSKACYSNYEILSTEIRELQLKHWCMLGLGQRKHIAKTFFIVCSQLLATPFLSSCHAHLTPFYFSALSNLFQNSKTSLWFMKKMSPDTSKYCKVFSSSSSFLQLFS